jgi:hypothetical protein
MLGHSRPKDGVASLAYARASTSYGVHESKTWVAGTSPVITSGMHEFLSSGKRIGIIRAVQRRE